MEVKINYHKEITKEQKNLIDKFISFLKRKLPLKDDVIIDFLEKRAPHMTTGQRTPNHLRILVKGRLTRDVLRTLAHEWDHEYQRSILKRREGKDAGGKNENEANAKAGELMKNFESNHKESLKTIYKPYHEKIESLESKLNETSYSNKLIISEIKKISIDKLPYGYDDLESFIDSETMKTHYTKHYKGYVEKLNVELEKIKGKDLDLEEIIKKISKFNTKVKNNGGGAFNHSLFWKMLSPKKQTLKDPLLSKINKSFGSLDEFKKVFEEEAKNRFGSGWVWLVLTKGNVLKIMTTGNQENPLMNSEKNGGYPLLGLDLWEHAYYLKYKNERDKYIHNFWKVVNWEFVNDQYISQTNKKPN